MTKSFLFRNVLGLCAIWISGWMSACGAGDGSCGQGNDAVPNIIEDDEDLNTFWIGRVGLDELNQLTGSDPGHTTLVQASFMDFYNYRVILADRMMLSEEGTCYIYTSRPVILKHCQPKLVCSDAVLCPEGYSCRYGRCLPKAQECDGQAITCPGIQVCEDGFCMSPECGECSSQDYECLEDDPVALKIEKAVFGGVTGGPVELVPEGANFQIKTKIIDGRAYSAESVSLQVLSTDQEYYFPAVELSIPSPAAPQLTLLGDIENPDLKTGPQIGIVSDRKEVLRVQWEPGEGDYFELLIIPGSGSSTPHMKLRCITFDDGCLDVPAEALQNLAVDAAVNFQLKLERHNYLLHSVKEGDTTKAAIIFDTSSSLEGTILR